VFLQSVDNETVFLQSVENETVHCRQIQRIEPSISRSTGHNLEFKSIFKIVLDQKSVDQVGRFSKTPFRPKNTCKCTLTLNLQLKRM
jgi:hypothetical protein